MNSQDTSNEQPRHNQGTSKEHATKRQRRKTSEEHEIVAEPRHIQGTSNSCGTQAHPRSYPRHRYWLKVLMEGPNPNLLNHGLLPKAAASAKTKGWIASATSCFAAVNSPSQRLHPARQFGSRHCSKRSRKRAGRRFAFFRFDQHINPLEPKWGHFAQVNIADIFMLSSKLPSK